MLGEEGGDGVGDPKGERLNNSLSSSGSSMPVEGMRRGGMEWERLVIVSSRKGSMGRNVEGLGGGEAFTERRPSNLSMSKSRTAGRMGGPSTSVVQRKGR